MERILLIGLAGSLGSLTRYLFQTTANHIAGRPTVLGTLFVNLSGAFLLGLLIGITEHNSPIPPHWRPIAASGFFGAYTTFSALMFESLDRMENGAAFTGIANIAGSVAIGLAVTYAGLHLGRTLTV